MVEQREDQKEALSTRIIPSRREKKIKNYRQLAAIFLGVRSLLFMSLSIPPRIFVIRSPPTLLIITSFHLSVGRHRHRVICPMLPRHFGPFAPFPYNTLTKPPQPLQRRWPYFRHQLDIMHTQTRYKLGSQSDIELDTNRLHYEIELR